MLHDAPSSKSNSRTCLTCSVPGIAPRTDELGVPDRSGAGRRQRSHKDRVVLVSSRELGFPAWDSWQESVVEGERWRGHHGEHQRRDQYGGQNPLDPTHRRPPFAVSLRLHIREATFIG
jgi:hypothetical protein